VRGAGHCTETLALNSPLDASSSVPRVAAQSLPEGEDDRDAQPAPPARPAREPHALAAALAPRRRAELDAIFASDGLLARAIDGYRPRVSQIEMASAVAATMQASGRAMPEPAMFEAQRRPARRLRADADADTRSDSAGGAANPDRDSQADTEDGSVGENTLIVEAGTGTGKTFAYLVPAML
jgi:ATP-dependent DNA helicase DinG